MKNIKVIKQYIGLALVSIGLFGGAIAALYVVGVVSNSQAALVFAVFNGDASNTPFLFGMLAFAGSWLLSSDKGE